MKEPETGNKKTSALFPASDSCLNTNPDLSTLNSEVTHPLHYSFSQKILTEIQSGSNQPDSVHKCNLWEHRPKRTEALPWPRRGTPSHLRGEMCTPRLHRPSPNTVVRQLPPTKSDLSTGFCHEGFQLPYLHNVFNIEKVCTHAKKPTVWKYSKKLLNACLYALNIILGEMGWEMCS